MREESLPSEGLSSCSTSVPLSLLRKLVPGEHEHLGDPDPCVGEMLMCLRPWEEADELRSDI